MPYKPYLSGFNKTIFLISILALLSACQSKNNTQYNTAHRSLQVIDSLILAGNTNSANKLLVQLRRQLDISNPAITSYYCFKSEEFSADINVKNIYADSALAYFSSNSRINNNPDEYFHALLTKGDAFFRADKYISALNYYFKAQKVLSLGVCDNGEIADKLGIIYYNQKNFALAGKYLAESYHKLGACNTNTVEKMFYLRQGALNNAGFAYQRAGFADSAKYYYLRDLDLINETDKDSLINPRYINSARAVTYDNLAGLYLVNGEYNTAKDYLFKCINLPNKDIDGIRIPPYLKLAEIYLKIGDYKAAAEAFKKSRHLLDLFKKDNPDSEIKWNKLYADYLITQHDPAGAYHYEDAYVKLRDSVNNGLADLYRLNVVGELNSIQQKQTLNELRDQDLIKKIYSAGITLFVILSVIIIILINRNLKKSKKNNADITRQNQQLQQAFTEVERVNKNYIRVMRVMAHDLRNPLSGITGLAKVLLDEDELNEDNKHMLKLIETTGLHSIEMINQLLKSGLADENEVQKTEKVDLKALVYDSVELLQFRANDKKQQIIFEGDDKPIIAEINHEKMWRVISNLIVNAIKFSHEGGVIKVAIKKDDKHILISVTDDGIGIPPEQTETVFEMFTPAKKAGTNGEEPFGLGLSISKKIIETHNGRIWLDSTPGKGSTFYIELPYTA